MWKWIIVLFLILFVSHCYRVESFRGGRSGAHRGYQGYGDSGWGWGWWPFNWWPVIWYDYE